MNVHLNVCENLAVIVGGVGMCEHVFECVCVLHLNALCVYVHLWECLNVCEPWCLQ